VLYSVQCDGMTTVNGETIKSWKEVIMAHFKAYPQNLPGQSEAGLV
jgi:hypothetical protein